MKNAILVLLLLAIVFVQSCKNDDDDNANAYQFQSRNEFHDFMGQHDWGCFLYIDDSPDDKSQMYVYFEAEWLPDDLTENDTFSLLLNNVDVPIQWYYEDGWLDSDGATLPQATSIKVEFKRNNTVIFDKTISVPGYPQLAELASFPVFTAPLTLSWSLNRNSHFQVLSMYVENSSSDRYKSYYLSPTARSCEIPANTFTLSNVNAYEAYIDEINIAEHNNCAFAVCTYDGIWDYLDGKSLSPRQSHSLKNNQTSIRRTP